VKMSDERDQLYAALAKARMDFGQVFKSKAAEIKSDRGSYSYTYSPLEKYFEAINKALGENGLALAGGIEYTDDGHMLVITHLGHTSGQWIENSLDMGVPKSLREMGSLMTYGRRFGVCLTVEIQGEDEDDDGEAAHQSLESRGRGQTVKEKHRPNPLRRREERTTPRQAESPQPGTSETPSPVGDVLIPKGVPCDGLMVSALRDNQVEMVLRKVEILRRSQGGWDALWDALHAKKSGTLVATTEREPIEQEPDVPLGDAEESHVLSIRTEVDTAIADTSEGGESHEPDALATEPTGPSEDEKQTLCEQATAHGLLDVYNATMKRWPNGISRGAFETLKRNIEWRISREKAVTE
jgi:hypothetical protein